MAKGWGTCRRTSAQVDTRFIDSGEKRKASVQKELRIQRVPLRRTEAGIADDAAQLFFGSAVAHTGGAHHVLLNHHRANIVAAEAQSGLADLQPLRHPARLHVLEVAEEKPRDSQVLQVLDCGRFVPATPAERGILRLE